MLPSLGQAAQRVAAGAPGLPRSLADGYVRHTLARRQPGNNRFVAEDPTFARRSPSAGNELENLRTRVLQHVAHACGCGKELALQVLTDPDNMPASFKLREPDYAHAVRTRVLQHRLR